MLCWVAYLRFLLQNLVCPKPRDRRKMYLKIVFSSLDINESFTSHNNIRIQCGKNVYLHWQWNSTKTLNRCLPLGSHLSRYTAPIHHHSASLILPKWSNRHKSSCHPPPPLGASLTGGGPGLLPTVSPPSLCYAPPPAQSAPPSAPPSPSQLGRHLLLYCSTGGEWVREDHSPFSRARPFCGRWFSLSSPRSRYRSGLALR